jgi:hypothetical protein
VPHEKMPEPKSVEPASVLLLPSPALLLAEGEAALKAKAARLRAQQRGRVAKGKKRLLWEAVRHLWGKPRRSQAGSQKIEVCLPSSGPHSRGKVHRATQPGRPRRKGESGDALRQLPPQETQGRE